MSEIQNNQGANSTINRPYNNERPPEPIDGIAFKGEKTDLRYDPSAAVKKTWINFNRPLRFAFGENNIEISQQQVDQVKHDLVFLSKNPDAVEKADAMFPSFQGYAERKGFKNPDALGLALEHYAATEEFISNFEAELEAAEE